MTTTEACLHAKRFCIVTTVKKVEADEDDGVFVLVNQDFEDPDIVEVELFCPDCSDQRPLAPNEWEVA